MSNWQAKSVEETAMDLAIAAKARTVPWTACGGAELHRKISERYGMQIILLRSW